MRSRFERVNFVVAFIGTLALILGMFSAVLDILGVHFILRTATACVFVSVVVAIGVNFRRLRNRQFAAEAIASEREQENRYICCPCSYAQSKEVSLLARSCFGSDTIALDRYEQLRVKNPQILACLSGTGGVFLGYFDVLPLRDGFGQLFLSGQVGEKDLTHEQILPLETMKTSRFVYLSGIAACEASTMSGMHNASILVWALLKYLETFYAAEGAVAFASAVTKDGEHLLKRLGFTLHSAGDTRRDRHPMYCVPLTREQIRRRLKGLPDYSALVKLPWNVPTLAPLGFSRNSRGVLPSQSLHRLSVTGTYWGS